MTDTEDYEPVRVHVASSDVPLHGQAPRRRRRRALKANTFTLTSSAPQQLFPQSDNRVEAWITSATETTPPVIYIARTQADAAAQAGGAAQIVGTDTTPFPVFTTDPVWVSAATGFPVTVSVVHIYEADE